MTRTRSSGFVAVLGIAVALAGCGDDEDEDRQEAEQVCAGNGGDTDADNVCQARDNCPDDANPDQRDFDGDGIGNECDETPTPCSEAGEGGAGGEAGNDADGDGVCDDFDNCLQAPNPQQTDQDADGTGDACDDEPLPPAATVPPSCAGLGGDEDEDDWCAAHDNCPDVPNPDQADTDTDGLGDACDDELQPPVAVSPASCAGLGGDEDEDDWCAAHDNCPDVPNPEQADTDADGLGDVCDDETCDGIDNDGDGEPDNGFEDEDEDGVANCVDLCPADAEDDSDGDELPDCVDPCPGDAANDEDDDGVCHLEDNCPESANEDQADSDDDEVGNVCDLETCDGLDNDGNNAADEGLPDADGDEICDEIDECPTDGLNDQDGDGRCSNEDNCGAVENAGQSDADNDGVGDACDLDSDEACGAPAELAEAGTIPLPDSLALQNMAVDPVRDVAYLTIDNTAGGSHANELIAIDIATQSILWSTLMGTAPNPIAVAADGSRAYVGVDDTTTVRVVDLERRSLCYEFFVGRSNFDDLLYAGDMGVLPSHPETVVMATRRSNLSPNIGGVFAFDHGVRRPVGTRDHTGAAVIELVNDTTAYGYNNTSTEYGFRQLRIATDGVYEDWVDGELISGFSTDILHAGGRIYATSGEVLDPSVPRIVGRFPDDGMIAVDDERAEAYIAISSSQLRVYSTETFLLLRSATLDVPGTPLQMARWGADGLIIRHSTGVYVTAIP